MTIVGPPSRGCQGKLSNRNAGTTLDRDGFGADNPALRRERGEALTVASILTFAVTGVSVRGT